MNNISDLPFFQILGGTERQRQAFVQRLQAALLRRTLCSAFIKNDEYRNNHGLLTVAKLNDLVILDQGIDFPAVQLLIEDFDKAKLSSASIQNVLVWTGGDEVVLEKFVDQLVLKLNISMFQVPVWACILIGGKSSRMGRPKHLIMGRSNRTWLERTAEILRPVVDGLVVSGAGELPEKLIDTVRLPDIPGVVGPLTGIVAAGRWQPLVSWIFVACDMPNIQPEAVKWLLSERRVGCWGLVPRLPESNHCEPLFAWYDFRAAQLFEQQLCENNLRISDVAVHAKIDNPEIPKSLCDGWQNINTPEQLGAVLK